MQRMQRMQKIKRLKFLSQLALKFSGVLRPFSLSSWLSILGLILGVATLVLSLALVESYEKAFKEGVFSIYSHLNLRVGDESEKLSSVKQRVKAIYKKSFNISEISRKEALLAHQGSVSGVSVVGVNPQSINSVIDIKNKIQEGEFFSDNAEGKTKGKIEDKAESKIKNKTKGKTKRKIKGKTEGKTEIKETLIGIGLQKKFDLKVGDFFVVVVPIRDYNRTDGFSRKILRLKVRGVVDFGTHDYNRRFIMTPKLYVNDIIEKPETYFSEVRIKLSEAEETVQFKKQWYKKWPSKDFLSTWQDESGGLIEAIQIEKIVIFFLVLIMVIVAVFNVSTNLFLNLSKRQKDFSILRTLGFRKKDIAFMLSLNGLFLGSIGLFLGFFLAYSIEKFLNFILIKGYFVPPEVYKLTSLTINLELKHLIIVSLSTLILCFISAIAPSLGIFKQTIVSGVKYE